MTAAVAASSAREPLRLPGVRIDHSARASVRPHVSGVPLFVGFIAEPSAPPSGATPRERYVDAFRPGPRAKRLHRARVHELRVQDHWDRGFEYGMTDQPVFTFDRWEQYAFVFEDHAIGYLDYAVRGFFENGGIHCQVVALMAAAGASSSVLQRALVDCFRAGGPLEDLAEPDLICVPDAVWGALGADRVAVAAVQQAVIAHCDRMNDRMAILDCMGPSAERHLSEFERGYARIALMYDHARASGNLSSRAPSTMHPDAEPARSTGTPQVTNGAVYWPWIQVGPLHRDVMPTVVPPCGHIAGVYARIDAMDGRHKAPANELLEGAHDVDDEVSATTLAELDEHRTNALRPLIGRGVRVTGARTLSTRRDWRYVNVRRVVLGLSRWAESALRDFVMETNDATLWERLRRRVDSHCLTLFQQGALRGDAAADAYFVKCDAENNPAASREVGQLICEVGLAISIPAEFIVVHLVQSADGTSLRG